MKHFLLKVPSGDFTEIIKDEEKEKAKDLVAQTRGKIVCMKNERGEDYICYVCNE